MSNQNREKILYGGIALGVVVGVAVSTYLWRRRSQALNLSPLEKAEQIIASCEKKLDSIERAVTDLKAAA